MNKWWGWKSTGRRISCRLGSSRFWPVFVISSMAVSFFWRLRLAHFPPISSEWLILLKWQVLKWQKEQHLPAVLRRRSFLNSSPWGFLEEVALELAFFPPHFSRMTKSFTFIMTNSNKPELHRRSTREFSCSLLSIPSPEGTTVTAVAFILFKVFLSLHMWMWISLSRVWLFVTPWTAAHQVLLSTGFSRQEYWSGLPFPSAGDLLGPRIKLGSPALQAVWAAREACTCVRTSVLISGITVPEPNRGLLAGAEQSQQLVVMGSITFIAGAKEEWEMRLRSTPEVV